MTFSTWRVRAAVLCLVLGPAATLAQLVVTPVPGGDASVAETLSAVAGNQTAMGWALALDVPLMLTIPALFCAGLMAGAATSRRAAFATALAVLPSIAAVVLLAQDALLHVAAQQGDRGAAIALVQDFADSPFIVAVTVGYLLSHVVAYPMLALALRRAEVLPLAVAAAFGAAPLLEVLGQGTGVKPVAVVGDLLQLIALGFCAAALRSRPARAVRAGVAHATS